MQKLVNGNTYKKLKRGGIREDNQAFANSADLLKESENDD